MKQDDKSVGNVEAKNTPYGISDLQRTSFKEDYFDLPEHYDRTYLHILPKDPEWIYAYWSVTEKFMIQIKEFYSQVNFNEIKLCLRLMDISQGTVENAFLVSEWRPDWGTTNYYIHIPNIGKRYFCELGFLTNKGEYLFAVRSNIISKPRQEVSEDYDSSWISLENQEVVFSGMSSIFELGGFSLVSVQPGELFSMVLTSPVLQFVSSGRVVSLWSSPTVSSFGISSLGLFSYGLPISSALVSSYGISSFIGISSYQVSSYIGALFSALVSSYAVSSYGISSFVGISSYQVSSYIGALFSALVSSYAVSSYGISSFVGISSYQASSYIGALFSALVSSYGVSSYGVSSFIGISSYQISSYIGALFSALVSSYAVSSYGISSFAGISSYQVSSYIGALFSALVSSYGVSSYGVSSFAGISSYQISSYQQALFSAVVSSYRVSSPGAFSLLGPTYGVSSSQSIFSQAKQENEFLREDELETVGATTNLDFSHHNSYNRQQEFLITQVVDWVERFAEKHKG